MSKRPLFVAIISILIMAIGFLNLILTSIMISRNVPVKGIIFADTPELIAVILAYAGGALLFIGGILAFRGMHVGRLMIVIWCILSLLLYADSIIPRVVYLVVIFLALFNKSANQFFKS
ncbi:hypothetical protein [Paenibacillus bovis]|uniref:DUF4064 domain-containing protein n=1 Tax=Paenibacillus bovis TaxID=1616788 RepID=A0A172ZJU4_9BACL|nr:hypothetical protein [Paenibacillus bovis]ANF97868.1 hypothetical protein AR543_18840 [Paenibacillus bovis]